jgi:hypothetical protein
MLPELPRETQGRLGIPVRDYAFDVEGFHAVDPEVG